MLPKHGAYPWISYIISTYLRGEFFSYMLLGPLTKQLPPPYHMPALLLMHLFPKNDLLIIADTNDHFVGLNYAMSIGYAKTG